VSFRYRCVFFRRDDIVKRGEDNTIQHEGRPQRAQSVEFCPAGGWPVVASSGQIVDEPLRQRTRTETL